MPFPEADVALKATTAVRPLTRLPPSGKNRISHAAVWGDAGEVRAAGEDGETGEDGGVGEIEDAGGDEDRVFSMVNGCIK